MYKEFFKTCWDVAFPKKAKFCLFPQITCVILGSNLEITGSVNFVSTQIPLLQLPTKCCTLPESWSTMLFLDFIELIHWDREINPAFPFSDRSFMWGILLFLFFSRHKERMQKFHFQVARWGDSLVSFGLFFFNYCFFPLGFCSSLKMTLLRTANHFVSRPYCPLPHPAVVSYNRRWSPQTNINRNVGKPSHASISWFMIPPEFGLSA